MHGRIDFIPSRLPAAHRALMRRLWCHASPIVSIIIENSVRTEPKVSTERSVAAERNYAKSGDRVLRTSEHSRAIEHLITASTAILR